MAAALASGQVGEEGVEEAFELLHELPDRVRTGQWVGDCFIYTNNAQRLNYYVGGQVHACPLLCWGGGGVAYPS